MAIPTKDPKATKPNGRGINSNGKSKTQRQFVADAFRESIATVDQQGKRNWIYPKKPKGQLHNYRVIVAVLCLGIMFLGPFLKWEGQPMFLFNLFERKFIIFGVTFWPQDFHLFVLAMITFFVFIVLFTVIFGRLWCGWACPQTIFMEMVFRKIEYLIEGDAAKQRKLNKAPWNAEKIQKKALKWTIFAAISFLIGNTVMAYLVGVDELSKMVTEGPFNHMGKFTGTIVFSSIFFFVFAWFREQACIVLCPYGRLQGVLLDNDSINVAYDYVRGEPRGKMRRGQTDEKKGDCIDCKLCVQVCPTGIDIRNGTQMECVNCTACIDACDEVMDKIQKPRGLVRFASDNNIKNKEKFKFTPRIIAYSVVLTFLVGVLGFLLVSRSDVETTILRTPGQLFQRAENGNITNLYNVQVVNKTINEYPIEFKVIYPENATIRLIGKDMFLKKQNIAKGTFFVEIPKKDLDGRKTKVVVEVWSRDHILDRTKTSFQGPN
ncbi:MAG: cytochrome c oxidase accessory protein CcoG [Bacteroidota bacterium]